MNDALRDYLRQQLKAREALVEQYCEIVRIERAAIEAAREALEQLDDSATTILAPGRIPELTRPVAR